MMTGSDTGPEFEVELGEDAAWVAAAIILVASLGGAVVLAEWPLWGVQPDAPGEPQLVEPVDSGTQLWPYTSRARSFEGRTLGINMVFYGDTAEIHTALTERSALEWEDKPVEEGEADSETVSADRIEVDPEAEEIGDVISWSPAEGSRRYAYVEVDGEGEWMDRSYELHSGTYLGQRMHIRAYEDPAGEWTAVQIHEEHWDWFRLRHTVTGVSDSQRELEDEFMGEPYVETVVRMPFENETADSDGWVTGIYLAGVGLPFVLVGLVGRSRSVARESRRFLRRRRREIALGAVLFGVYTAVRWLGIAGELVFSGISPKFVAAPLYVALVVGVPAIAYVLGRGSDGVWAFTFAGLGLGTAIVGDYAAMGTSVLPLRVVLHRLAVLLAIGLIAVGGAKAVEQDEIPAPLIVGAVGWTVSILAPLFGYI
ncbi:MAG: hypothetical protein ACQET5_04300 [Halobacteriota archaeon]|uniref:hypothetical protein n=1 Tax=Natronomonas sp. TaxID=2184060 RepID=UPI003974830C